MNKIKLLPSVEYLNECYKRDGGVLTWLVRPRSHFILKRIWNRWNTIWSGKTAGRLDLNGYICVRIHGADYKMHRIIWKMVHGEEPPSQLDHIDHNRSNNHPSNLRAANQTINNRNASRRCDNRTGVTGVSYMPDRKKPYYAYGRTNGKQNLLGRYDTLEEAAAVREKFIKENDYHPNHGR